ncbi:MAG: hypothetical protein WCT01_00615 [Candidatus Shapirobacteria bacterium]
MQEIPGQIVIGEVPVNVSGVPEGCVDCPKTRAVVDKEVGKWKDDLTGGQGVSVSFIDDWHRIERGRRFLVTSGAVEGQSESPVVRIYANYRMDEACPEGCGGSKMPTEKHWVDYVWLMGGLNRIVRAGQ